MAEKKINRGGTAENRTLIQFNLAGLIAFSAALVLATGALTWFLLNPHRSTGSIVSASPAGSTSPAVSRPAGEIPAWGDLMLTDFELDKPDEYVAFEAGTNAPSQWVFPNMQPAQVRAYLAASGLSAAQVDHALCQQCVVTTPTNTIVRPDDDFILELTPETQGKLYNRLSEYSENHYIKFPFVFTGNSFDRIAAQSKLDDQTVGLVKKLMYPRGDAQCFSDLALVLRHLSSENARINLIKAFSRQSAVLVRLRVTPETDVDKILGYWAAPAAGVRFKDVRPLLESLKRVPNGGSISIMYLLPQFARQRLYTFPMPAQVGDPMMDCHWSTMNFFNEIPDNRFNDPAYLGQYVKEHFYEIGKANAYGDVIFLQDAHGTIIHSAVHLADDLVFTKNGRSTVQPWIIMHLSDLMGIYSASPGIQVKIFRNRDT